MSKPKKIIYVSPYEWGIVKPLIAISEYIKKRLKGRSREPSRYEITRIFRPLEEYLRGELETSVIALIMDDFARHYGFTSEEEKEKVQEAVIEVVNWLGKARQRDPIRVYKLLRNIRILLIGLVKDYITAKVSIYEKQL